MSQKITSFADVHRIIDAWRSGTKRHTYSLDHMFELLEFLGNPHKQLRVIHVAGTSGKTSTAYYIAALLQGAGKRVGLTISPHVDEVNERVQIDLVPLPEAQFVSRFSEFLQKVEQSGVVPNYFELFIAFAFWEFAARKVDYAVVEVGIGGLLDSTNVFSDPEKVCVITDIGYDHMSLLGNTLSEIADQKAGIIQLHNAVFCYQQSKEVDEVIHKMAVQKQADFHTITPGQTNSDLDFLPLFEQRNFGLALEAAKYIQQRDQLRPLGDTVINRAAHTYIPARMEVCNLDNKTLILDVAHNPQKMHALMKSVSARFGDEPVAVLVRLSARKEHRSLRLAATLQEITKTAQHIIMTSDGEAGDDFFAPKQLTEACQALGFTSFEIIVDPKAAFAALRKRPEPVLIATGSFRLLNHIRPILRVQQTDGAVGQ